MSKAVLRCVSFDVGCKMMQADERFTRILLGSSCALGTKAETVWKHVHCTNDSRT